MNLIVFSGLPGTGKSALAERVGRKYCVPVFAKDWLEAALLRCELIPAKENKPLSFASYQLLTTLAARQLMLGQSVILDSVASTESIRDTWKRLAFKYNATWLVIECICSDERVHRARLKARRRDIPGWHELDWSEVERVRGYYQLWNENRLILDGIHPLEDNFKIIVDHLSAKEGKL